MVLNLINFIEAGIVWALIIPGLAGAWHIMMFKTFFLAIPVSLIE